MSEPAFRTAQDGLARRRAAPERIFHSIQPMTADHPRAARPADCPCGGAAPNLKAGAKPPRYAACFFVEHGGFGAAAAAPIARDVMTFLFDKEQAMASLAAMEQQWGGTMEQRMNAQAQAWAAAVAAGQTPPPAGRL